MTYRFSYRNASEHLIDIEFVAGNISSDETLIQLPAWRPGRYELANFAKYIKQFIARDEKGDHLSLRKITKDQWAVQTKGVKELHIDYSFYANTLNAGSTYLDETQLYVNPVNCCVYIPSRMNEECLLELKLPPHYQVATALPPAIPHKKKDEKYDKRHLRAKNYDELADSPFIASPSLQHNVFILDGVEFNLWFQGEVKPNWSKIINDFFIFINEQFVTMKGTIPVEEYHFLFQILPYPFHHGVEHLASTVIALGPSYDVMRGELFLEFLSISSHELFHSWNVKAIRPAEMFPYDYTKENYSRLGFVTEGITTYYGDFFLYRAGIYSDFEFASIMSKHLQKHFDNFGKYNLSVGDSSFDTWLDGYTEIVPNRKTSIYTEGCLIAFMLDILIRRNSKNQKSLDNVMIELWNEFAKKNKGYSEKDFQQVCEKMAGVSLDEFFTQYVYKAASYENALRECVDYIGVDLLCGNSKKYFERFYGIKITPPSPGACSDTVLSVYPDSPAAKAGLEPGDEIIGINGYAVCGNLEQWSKYFSGKEVNLLVRAGKKTRTCMLKPSDREYYKVWYVQKTANPTDEQKQNFSAWSRRRF